MKQSKVNKRKRAFRIVYIVWSYSDRDREGKYAAQAGARKTERALEILFASCIWRALYFEIGCFLFLRLKLSRIFLSSNSVNFSAHLFSRHPSFMYQFSASEILLSLCFSTI